MVLWGPADILWQQGSVQMLLPCGGGRWLVWGLGMGGEKYESAWCSRSCWLGGLAAFMQGAGGRDECGLSP